MTESRDYFPLSVKILVGVKGLEPPASCSQSRRATNCAMPRKYRSLFGCGNWLGMRESNSHQRFWRPLSYHLTNPLYTEKI